MTTAVAADSSYPHRSGRRPSSVRWLFALLIADIGLGLVTVITLLVSAPADNDLVGLWYFAAIFVAVLTAVEGPLAFAIRNGRRWAWIIQLVLAVAALPFAVWDVVQPTGFGPQDMALTGSSALQIAIVVLLLVHPTRTFVQLRRRTGR